MSWLNTASESRIWMSALGFESEDPYRSRNIAAEVRSSYIPKLFRDSTKVRHIDTGGVFEVLLYEHKKTLFAVKKARTHHRGRGEIAFQEIRVVSKPFLRKHTNIIDIFGWDWSDSQSPVLFTYFSEQGTLRDFLRRNKDLPLTKKRHLAVDIASGLHALHTADIAHGDVKLTNTLVFPDTRNPGSWIAKVADFSHSVFGLSLKRQTSYPGTVLYNAPEVRGRDAYVNSAELIRCESFSYGLLLWEILSDGEEYFDPAWIGGVPEKEGTTKRELFLQKLPKNGLLSRAFTFICSNFTSKKEMAIFYSALDMTLKDNPACRKDLAIIALMLDTSDRANMEYSLADLSLEKINVWDFNLWREETWASKKQFVSELQDKVFSPRQPNHAELHFLISRCYTEGYGVPRSIPTAMQHLLDAYKFGSIDAIWIVEACRGRLPSLDGRKYKLVSSSSEYRGSVVANVQKVLSAISSSMDNTHDEMVDEPMEELITSREFPAYVQAWNKISPEYTQDELFEVQVGDKRQKYQWEYLRNVDSYAKDYGVLLCNVNMQYRTLLSPHTTAPFLEVCSSLGCLREEQLLILQDCQFADTSYRSQGQFYVRLMVTAARHGQWSLIKNLMRVRRQESLEKGIPLSCHVDPETGESPLHYISSLQASDDDRLSLIHELHNFGYNVNGIMTARSCLLPFGIEIYGTPLHVAIRSKCLRTVKALVKAGADCSLSYGDAPPPLILATSMHCSRIVEYLLSTCVERRKALESLGVPTKKGWFEHLFPELEGDCRLYSLIKTARPLLKDI